MTGKRRKDPQWHVSLSIGTEMWNQLLRSALPLKLAEGHFDVVADLRQAISYLEVRQRVKGLLESANPPEVFMRVQRRARTAIAGRRELFDDLIEKLIHVEGEWHVQIDQEDSAFESAEQRVGVEAWLHGHAEGIATLLWKSYEVPFTLDRRAGAVLHLKDIRYDPERKAVVGDLGDLVVDFGEHVILQLLSRAAQLALEKQLERISPVEVLKKDQVEMLASPLSGPFKVEMGVENLTLEITDDDVTLRVRFGFTQKQIETTD